MSKKLLTVLIAIALATGIAVVSTTAFAAGPLPNQTVLKIDPGSGSKTNVPCSVGSCFSMEQTPGVLTWTDITPGTDTGLVLGKNQVAGNQLSRPAGTDPAQITAVWSFFGNNGTNFTAPQCGDTSSDPAKNQHTCVTTGAGDNQFWNSSCTNAVDCLNRTYLGSWHVAWNGIAVPMGSKLGCLARADAQSKCEGVTKWILSDSPAKLNSTFDLRHAWVVPHGDPSGFGDVPYTVLLRGVISSISPTCYNSTTQKFTCEGNDACAVYSCDPDALVSCSTKSAIYDDGNPCTFDTCGASGVVHVPILDGTPCTDKNPDGTPNLCTLSDACSAGNCVGTTKTCDVPDACTVATCNIITGECVQTALVCPGDKCTTGTCDPVDGCIFTGKPECANSSNNNFTMLDPANGIVGGTNDVRFTWDRTPYTSVQEFEEKGSNATISSPCPFFGNTWTSHDVAVYGPGTYTVYADCPAGNPGCGEGTPITFTVGEGEFGAHMLFNWSSNTNIDVIDIWKQKAAFGASSMFTGVGGCGDNDAGKVWDLMSIDWDGNGVNGKGMVDGPFSDFNANFNLMLTTNVGSPSKPKLVFPEDKATGLPTAVELRWKRSTDADNDPITYNVNICTDLTFTNCNDVPVSAVASRSSKGIFYAGGAGLFMIGMTFFGGLRGNRRIVLLLIIVVLLSGGALIACSNSNGSNVEGRYLDIGEMSYKATGLKSNTTYYWKVSATDGKGNPTVSNVNSFTTQ